MRQYLELLHDILDNGADKGDRTGTGTYSVFGCQLRFDLQAGFPLLTTKKVHFRSVAEELFWFMRGETNINTLNASIWDEWRQPYTFTRPLVTVQPRIVSPQTFYEGDYSYRGINAARDSVDAQLAGTWVKMMKRCYDPHHHRYNRYGNEGVTVAAVWHNCEAFIRDVKLLPHWWYKKNDWNNFQLDKDYYGSKQYGPATSVWLHTKENNFYTKHTSPIFTKDEDGVQHLFLTLGQASEQLGLPTSTLHRFVQQGMPLCLKGSNKRFKGWEFGTLDVEGNLLRLELIEEGDLGPVYAKQWRNWGGTDQLQCALDTLRNNPNCRRNIVCSWNVNDIPNMALPPCHCLFQFYVADGKLSLQVYQRSCDLFLGVPFNLASYALLTHLLAKMAKLKVGDLIWTGGDVHLYKNHLRQAELQLSRSPRELPKLEVTNEALDLSSWCIEDIKLTNYDPHPRIKAEVSV